jgi:tyrosyl-tRNA synthetase
MKIADADVERYLRMFTMLSVEEIDQIMKTHMVKGFLFEPSRDRNSIY